MSVDEPWYREVERPDWHQYFLGMCFYVADRSEDYNTQHGCVLTNSTHHIIGTGYNSFPAGTSKGLMSNTRPNKNRYMIHAERNAMDHTTYQGSDIICYVSARPCLGCLYAMGNKNIQTIYYADTNYHYVGWEAESEDFDKFVRDKKIKIYNIVPDTKGLERSLGRLKNRLD